MLGWRRPTCGGSSMRAEGEVACQQWPSGGSSRGRAGEPGSVALSLGARLAVASPR